MIKTCLSDLDRTVTVIVNVYNGEDYIGDCLNSICSQTHKELQILVCDNHSTDRTLLLVKDINDSRITLIQPPYHVNLYAARQYTLSYRSGRYLMFLDADDMWLPEKVSSTLALHERSNCTIAYSNFYYRSESKSFVAFTSPQISGTNIGSKVASDYKVGLLTLSIDTHKLPKNSLFFDKYYEIVGDFEFVLRLLFMGCSLHYDNEPHAICRIRLESLSNSRQLRWSRELLHWLFVNYKNLLPKHIVRLVFYSCYLLMIYCKSYISKCMRSIKF